NEPNSQSKFPIFRFPSSFSSPVGMVFHPRSHFLYAYGNQEWEDTVQSEVLLREFSHYTMITWDSYIS
ncbi:CATSPERB isoform 1, partial [Pan troglodytes]